MKLGLIVVLTGLLVIRSPYFAFGQQGSLTITPDSGPVGTVVTLDGQGCGNVGQPPLILFGGTGLEGQGTAGSSAVPGIVADQQGKFRVSYTIPAEIGPQQQWQGGPVKPGRYNFTSKPPICQTFFTVTTGFPSTGGPDAAWTAEGWTLAIAGASMLTLGIVGAAAAWRTSKRLP